MNLLPIILPVLAFVIFLGVFAKELRIQSLLQAGVKSYLSLYTLLVLSVELLSTFEVLNRQSLILFWLIVCIAGVLIYILSGRRLSDFQAPKQRSRLPLSTVLLMAALLFILTAAFTTALLYPPNNWDSMTYHMSRVVYWIDNQSVSFYPTHNLRQLYQMPAAEYGLLHLQLLAGTDLFLNLLQWFSFCLSICIATLIAAELSLSRNAQLVTAIVVATIPMAVLQSSSTQNDLVLSGFILAFAYFMLRLGKNFSWSNLIFAGIGLGLAVLTKGTGLVYAAAAGVVLSLPIIWAQKKDKKTLARTILGLFLIGILALTLNATHIYRNVRFCGRYNCAKSSLYINQELTLPALISNGLRNAGLHIGTPIKQVNDFSNRAIGYVLGDHALNPKTTFGSTIFVIPFGRHEDQAGNPLHLALIILAILITLAWIRKQKKAYLWYSAAVLLASFLYLLVFKWQPWASRLHTPLFVLAAPLIVAAIVSLAIGKDRLLYLVAAILILYSSIFVLANNSRSIISLDWLRKERTELYFQNRPILYECYVDIIDYLNETDVKDVGLYLGGDDLDYPFWVLAGQVKGHGSEITFRHVGVSKPPAEFRGELSTPKYVIATRSPGEWDQREMYDFAYSASCAQILMLQEGA